MFQTYQAVSVDNRTIDPKYGVRCFLRRAADATDTYGPWVLLEVRVSQSELRTQLQEAAVTEAEFYADIRPVQYGQTTVHTLRQIKLK